MPQLDPSSYVSQIFWMLVCFCSLWALLSIFVIPKIADVIEQRKRKIDEYIQKADTFNKKAKESLDKYHAILEQAEQTSQAEMQKGRDELKQYLHFYLFAKCRKQSHAEAQQKNCRQRIYIGKRKKGYHATN